MKKHKFQIGDIVKINSNTICPQAIGTICKIKEITNFICTTVIIENENKFPKVGTKWNLEHYKFDLVSPVNKEISAIP